MNRRHAVLAAMVVAAAATSACSTNAAPKPWADVTPSPVSADVPVWADVTGQGVEAPRDAVDKAQFSATPKPGVKVLHDINQARDMDMCTIGPAVSGGYLTAGHCAKAYSPVQYLQTTPTGDPHFLGTASVPDGPVDAAVIRTGAGDAGATRIAGTWPVAGVLTQAGVQKLVPAGSMICIDGAVTGVKCGERVPDEGGQLVYRVPSAHGDSGAPVFVVDPTTRRAALVGILSEGDDTGTDRKSTAVYLESALLATGTAARLAPHVDAFDGPEFSGRIAVK
ncbi:chymotrypsin family serine protease [Mycobacteroides abscessus]|uniref:hypothetical protein n=1 Tax=Mycobacteroides abscessus TaxID=36809 RepID=UPI001042591F|nr:hypothetical protein [Mycobacteroides abscessus]